MATCEFKANLGYEVQSDIKQEMEEGREGVEEGGRGGGREENKDTDQTGSVAPLAYENRIREAKGRSQEFEGSGGRSLSPLPPLHSKTLPQTIKIKQRLLDANKQKDKTKQKLHLESQ